MNDIDAYLAANRGTFTREALTDRLVASGHDPAAVAAAWTRIDAAAAGSDASDAAPPPDRHTITGIVLIVAAVVGYLYVGFYGIVGISFSVYGFHGNTGSENGAFVAFVVLYGIAMLLGLIYAVRRIWRAAAERDAASRLGVALVVAGALLVGINGLCVAGNVAYMGLR